MANATPMMNQVFDLNNKGIAALASGMAGRASAAAIRQAMVLMDTVCANAGGEVLGGMEPSLSYFTVPVPVLGDEHFYIFNHAFSIMPAGGNTNHNSNETMMGHVSVAYCCAALTFNMALTYHALGRTSGDSRKLRAACRLYDHCVQLVTSVRGIPPPTPADNLYMLQMMATNNAAQIQYCLAEFKESHTLMSRVRGMMHQIFEQVRADPSSCEAALAYLPREALDEINLNGVVCCQPTTAPTA